MNRWAIVGCPCGTKAKPESTYERPVEIQPASAARREDGLDLSRFLSKSLRQKITTFRNHLNYKAFGRREFAMRRGGDSLTEDWLPIVCVARAMKYRRFAPIVKFVN
jgi:hypothetical protein